MKKAKLLIIIVLIECAESNEVKNIFGYASIVFFSEISEILSGKNKMMILGNYYYKVQYRFSVENQYWNIGHKVFNTYVTIGAEKYKLSDLLMDTNILIRKGRKGELVNINKEDILQVNMVDNDFHGNISFYGDYIYVSLAWVNLKFGSYSFINLSNNEKINILNPILIIGIGETGTF